MTVPASLLHSAGHHRQRRAVRTLFPLAAVFLGLLPLLIAEIVCRTAGWGILPTSTDPFVGFAATTPLFELDPDRQVMQISAARQKFFRRAEFPVNKQAGEFRIFVFGGSTVQGRPYSVETSFPTFLAALLDTVQPERTWRVVNCGGVSYASYRLLPIMQECLNYQPDLMILCTGQNEFLEDTSWRGRKQLAPLLQPVLDVAAKLQCVRGLMHLLHATPNENHQQSGRPVLPAEVLTRLDQSNGLARFVRDDQQSANVVRHFEQNLLRGTRLCQIENVPLLLIRPPVNLRDCPPFKSEPATEASPQRKQSIVKLLKQARELAAASLPAAINRAAEATRVEPRFALSWYELGQLQFLSHDYAAANQSFQRAVDEDLCPLRITSSLVHALQSHARVSGTPLLDAHALFTAESPGNILGDNLMVDHVHPSFRGHEKIAILLLQWMLQNNFASATTETSSDELSEVCRQIVIELPDSYFLRGQRTLESLRLWAAGRALEPILVTP